jgi:hypothetical protein
MGGSLLDGAKLKVKRAYSHVESLERLIQPPGEKLYSFALKQDSLPQKPMGELRLVKVPEMAPVLIGEVAYLLRSSLDVAAVGLALHNMPGTGVSGIYFPFANSKEEWDGFEDDNSTCRKGTKRSPRAKMRKLSAAAQAVIDELKPYKGGNKRLHGLNVLCNTDKHRKLVVAASLFEISNLISFGKHAREDQIGAGIAAELSASLFAAARPHGLKDGFAFDLSPRTPAQVSYALNAMNKHIDLAVAVCFSDTEVFDGEPVTRTLYQLCRMTDGILDSLANTV